jgi:hypothetical protein
MNIQKPYYLKNYLKDRAEQFISLLELTKENDNVALQLIKERYNNKCVIVQKRFRILMNLPAIIKESVSNLRELIDSKNMDIEFK